MLVGEHDPLEVLDAAAVLAQRRARARPARVPEFGPVSNSVSGSSSTR